MKTISKRLILMGIGFCVSCACHNSGLIYTPIDHEIRSPRIDKMEKGLYPCGSNIHRCMTFEDYKTHALNDKRLEEAHHSLLNIIDHMNRMYLEQYEKPCSWYDFPCKRERKQLPPLGH